MSDSRYVTDEERFAIYEAYIELGTFKAVAARVGRDRETIARQINGEGFERYQDALTEATKRRVSARMLSAGDDQVDNWLKAARVAADKGDHKPAKELLQTAGIIAGDQVTHNLTLGVLIGAPGRPALADPFEGAEPAPRPQISDVIDAEPLNGECQAFDT